jgi:2-keto-4-pentenoate hydratase/2-oxohepta-3-ene-1,7-dioic acid hydratase in catechol pathway
MKLVDFSNPSTPYPHLGLAVDDSIIEIGESAKGTLLSLIRKGQHRLDELRVVSAAQPVLNGHERPVLVGIESGIRYHAPIRQPASLRDFYAFEQHVRTANENRGRNVPKEWYEIPVFYFSNHAAIYGPDDVIPYPRRSSALDYELEVACVIGKEGRDIPADRAEDYIFGYMIFNDWSARDIQRQEMAVGLGPAKSKDFASSFGPYLVTPDELADRHTGRPGVYDLEMIARVNGVERSRGNWKDLYWSFGQMIERASEGVTLRPGDVIGSGTVGTGCLLELTRAQGPYLQLDDVVELEIERLGILRNTVGQKS